MSPLLSDSEVWPKEAEAPPAPESGWTAGLEAVLRDKVQIGIDSNPVTEEGRGEAVTCTRLCPTVDRPAEFLSLRVAR